MRNLPIEVFGSCLLRSGDLDPVYVMLDKAFYTDVLSWPALSRWCVAYWCCYHAGVSSHMAAVEDELFFPALTDVAVNFSRQWPRGTERRHFRGAAASQLVEGLRARYSTAEEFIFAVAGPHCPDKRRTFKEVARRVQEHVGFGPWIAFKVADMMERVLGFEVDFSDCQLEMYKEPVAGAFMACHAWDVTLGGAGALKYAVERLIAQFGDELAPPVNMRSGARRRFVNLQEIETILCKWKSHIKGHYPLGKDTKEVSHALKGWGPLAEQLDVCLFQGLEALAA